MAVQLGVVVVLRSSGAGRALCFRVGKGQNDECYGVFRLETGTVARQWVFPSSLLSFFLSFSVVEEERFEGGGRWYSVGTVG